MYLQTFFFFTRKHIKTDFLLCSYPSLPLHMRRWGGSPHYHHQQSQRNSWRIIRSCLNVIWNENAAHESPSFWSPLEANESKAILMWQKSLCMHSLIHAHTQTPNAQGLHALGKTTAPVWYWSFTQAVALKGIDRNHSEREVNLDDCNREISSLIFPALIPLCAK